jgi:hypothetical protein
MDKCYSYNTVNGMVPELNCPNFCCGSCSHRFCCNNASLEIFDQTTCTDYCNSYVNPNGANKLASLCIGFCCGECKNVYCCPFVDQRLNQSSCPAIYSSQPISSNNGSSASNLLYVGV